MVVKHLFFSVFSAVKLVLVCYSVAIVGWAIASAGDADVCVCVCMCVCFFV